MCYLGQRGDSGGILSPGQGMPAEIAWEWSVKSQHQVNGMREHMRRCNGRA